MRESHWTIEWFMKFYVRRTFLSLTLLQLSAHDIYHSFYMYFMSVNVPWTDSPLNTGKDYFCSSCLLLFVIYLLYIHTEFHLVQFYAPHKSKLTFTWWESLKLEVYVHQTICYYEELFICFSVCYWICWCICRGRYLSIYLLFFYFAQFLRMTLKFRRIVWITT